MNLYAKYSLVLIKTISYVGIATAIGLNLIPIWISGYQTKENFPNGNSNSYTENNYLAPSSNTIYVDSAASGVNDGSSWANAFTKLQNALIIVQACDTIKVAKGTYFPDEGPGYTNNARDSSFYIPDSVVVLGGYPAGGGMLTERNFVCNETILSGDIGIIGDSTDNSFHVVVTKFVDSTTLVDGFLITRGNANGSPFPKNAGGGWYNDGSNGQFSNPIIRSCEFRANSAGFGGAMFNNGFSLGVCSPQLSNCVFKNNTAISAGGAIYNSGGLSAISSPVLTNCLFTGNSASFGGAMFNNGSSSGTSSPVLNNCVFNSNLASNLGGAIYNSGFTGISSPILIKCVLNDNSASFGGAMFNDGYDGASSPTLTNCVLKDNSAITSGGALYNDGRNTGIGSPIIINCELTGNIAGFGGAIFNGGTDLGVSSPLLTNCVLSGNNASTAGGALYNSGGSGTSNPKLKNCIFWNNTAVSSGPVFYNFPNAAPVVSNCIFQSNYSQLNAGCTNCVDTTGRKNKYNTDPLFIYAPLGTSAPTSSGNFHLLPTSPAIDMGTISGAPSDDLDGNVRPYNDSVDIGAYELTGPDCNTFISNIIYVDSSATGTNDGNSWANAYFDLQDALLAARFCDQVDTIKVAKGTYYPSKNDTIINFDPCTGIPTDTLILPYYRNISFDIPDSIAVLGGYEGTTGDTLADRNWACNKTILCGDIDRNGDTLNNSYHVIVTESVDSTTIVDGFCIIMGNSNGTFPNNAGGGWNNIGSNGQSSNPIIKNCTFSGNSAFFGGGMRNAGFNLGVASPLLINCLFTDNSAKTSGGAMYNNGQGGVSSPKLTNCVLNGNFAVAGGSIYNDGTNAGISSPVMTNCVLNDNSAITSGGSLYNNGSNAGVSSPIIINCEFTGNIAGFGGALVNDGTVSGVSSPLLTNCVLSGNNASTAGGALYNNGSTGTSAPKLKNCILWNNTAVSSGSVFYNLPNAAPVVSNCIFQSNYSQLNAGCTNCVDTTGRKNKYNTDPLFIYAPLGSSAPTSSGNFHLLPTSPAIDMGTISGAPSDDLDGNVRPYNDSVDIGAYELTGPDCNTFISNIIYVDSSATGTNDGNSWANAYFDLQDALLAARFCDLIDTIKVAKGTYYPSKNDTIINFDPCTGIPTDTLVLPYNRIISFDIPDSITVLGGYEGTMGDTLTDRNWVCNKTILSGDIDMNGNAANNSYHVVVTEAVKFTLSVDGFCITMGNANDTIFPKNSGGGWYNDGSNGQSSNPTIRNCVFSRNFALFGGAMYNLGSAGNSSPVLLNCVFKSNFVFSSGGAIYNDGSNTGTSSPTLTNCVLSGNFAVAGGSMFNDGNPIGNSSPVLTNCVFSGNLASTAGGAMYNLGNTGNSNPNLTNSIFWNNIAFSSGPVFYNFPNAVPEVSNCIFQSNYSVLNAGCTNCVDTTGGNNKYSTDPQFIYAPLGTSAPNDEGNFHLLPTSPAIDMGINDSVTVAFDLDGNPRIVNGIVDIGVYEFSDPYFKVVTKAILGGPYFPAGDSMSTSLRAQNLLPSKCPFDTTMILTTIPINMVDWVRLDLVDTITGDTIYASQCGCLLSNGLIQTISGDSMFTFCLGLKQYYSLKIMHRNHLSVRSRSLAIFPGSTISFDFRAGNQLYIDPTITGITYHNVGLPEMLTSSGRFALWPGDANADGQIKYQGSGNDRGLILAAIGGSVITNTVSGYLPTDISLNGQVKYQGSGNDRAIVLTSIGGTNITKIAKAHN